MLLAFSPGRSMLRERSWSRSWNAGMLEGRVTVVTRLAAYRSDGLPSFHCVDFFFFFFRLKVYFVPWLICENLLRPRPFLLLVSITLDREMLIESFLRYSNL